MRNASDQSYRSVPLHATLALAALVIIVAGMKLGASLLVPLLLAFFIAVVCTEPVHWLHNRGLPMRLAVLLTLLVLMGLVTLLGFLVANSFTTFVEALPDIETRLRQAYWQILNRLSAFGLAINPEEIKAAFGGKGGTTWVSMLLSELGNFFMQSMVVSLLVVFMMFETLHFRKKISLALANPAPSLQRFAEFSVTLKRYLAVKTIISLTTGILVWLACLLVGVKFALLWAVLAFALNFIPNIGSAIAAVPPVLLLLVSQQGGLGDAFLLSLAYLGINFVLGNLVEPRLMGRALGLSTLVAFVSLVVWGWIFGVAGLLLSVLLTMTLKIALDSHPQTRWMAHLLGPGAHIDGDGAQGQRLRQARRPPSRRRQKGE
ncbi:AI-2E family transporter [Halomonas cibimaris]|uniref:AI-2E family transporter n=1 Tax=Halomonas cibimaris TaxID=657012 RepID=A0ABP7LKM0_9GAMM